MSLISKIIGTKNDRELKKMKPRVQAIGAFEPKLLKLTDDELAQRIQVIRGEMTKACDDVEARIKEPKRTDYNAVIDPYLHETFAIVREAGKRILGMRHYDVQMIGGMVLHSGRIAEMRTGEGKTLVATLPTVLNALASRGVHVVTVNDYLASRDAEWMGRLYRFLGLSTGVVVPNQGAASKREAYQSDITYGQNNEFGFDYLRDNMKFSLDEYAQRGHFYCVVDEVDSILIDEARTPLIISGPADQATDTYKVTDKIVPKLRKDEDFTLDEKARSVMLTEEGVSKVESLLEVENLYDPANIELLHHTTKALQAHSMYKRDVDYVVENGEVVIVDDHTGRLMHGRRWSDGLHQAVEAKENVKIQAENQTLATVTFQNYFRMYSKLSGMTGTADTEAEEFASIYDLDVIVVPTNKPIARIDDHDLVYKTEPEKFRAVAADIVEAHKRKQPVLVGTVSVEKSEVLSRLLKRAGVAHEVLNAKRHRDEAAIVAQAGRLQAVTIATNMAGRGTDILLGGNAEFMARAEVAKKLGQTDDQVAEFGWLSGDAELIDIDALADADSNEIKHIIEAEAELEADGGATVADIRKYVFDKRKKYYEDALALYENTLERHEAECKAEKQKVLEAGGLHVVGTERHESRRIDNQLRGRSGRQGDPGSSRFFLSLQDDLMRIFGSDRMIGMMERLGMEDDMPIESGMVSKSIANAQKRVEGMHFDSRKNVLEYDDVMNQQRKTIYGLRRQVLDGHNNRELVMDLLEAYIIELVKTHCPEKTAAAEWRMGALAEDFGSLLGLDANIAAARMDRDDIMDHLFTTANDAYAAKVENYGDDVMAQMEQYFYLQTIDTRWKEHLQAMDHLREGIGLRGYGQRDPKQEYKKEGYNLFLSMRALIRDEVLSNVFNAKVQTEDEQAQAEMQALIEQQRLAADAFARLQSLSGGGDDAPVPAAPQGGTAGGMSAAGNMSMAGGPSIAGGFAGASFAGTMTATMGMGMGGQPAPEPAAPAAPAEPMPTADDAGSDGEGRPLNRAERRAQKKAAKRRR